MLLILQAIRRFVHKRPAFCSFSVAQPSAMAKRCARQFGFNAFAQPLSLLQPHFNSSWQPMICDAWGIVIHEGTHISLATFTQPHSLGHGNGGGKRYCPAVASLVRRPLLMLTYNASQLSATQRKFRLNFDIFSGKLNVYNENTSIVTQDLYTKLITSECFLIAATGQTNKIGKIYISAKALSMDIGASAVEEIVKNGSDIISNYFRGKFSDVSKGSET